MSDTVYLTGATGFVGQMIVRQCEADASIAKVYCPIRTKKGIAGRERFQSLFGSKKCAFIDPEAQVPQDVTLVLLNAYSVKFFTPVEEIMRESVRPMLDILDQVARGVGQVRGITVVSTAYVQPPHPFARNTNNRVPFLLEGICSASELYQDLVEGNTSWEEVTMRFSDKLLPYHKKNCYASSKNILEHLVLERYPSLPIAIVRPSIVAPSRDGSYGYDSRAGFPLFVGIARHPIMMAPCSEGRLNLVFVEDVASDIVRAAQTHAAAVSSSSSGHPTLPSTSSNVFTPIECFRKLAPQVPRIHIGNSTLRSLVRALELAAVFLLLGKKRAALVRTLYQNYDMIMSQEFDFEAAHEPVADDAVRGAHIHYDRQLERVEEADKKPKPLLFHAVCHVVGFCLMGLVAMSHARAEWKHMAFAGTFGMGVVASHGVSNSPRFFRYFTIGFDYLFVFVVLNLYKAACNTSGIADLWKVAMISAGCQVLSIIRDGMYMNMFPTLIAKDKVGYRPGLKELAGTIQTWASATALLATMTFLGFTPMAPVTSLQECMKVWLEFFALVMLNDYPFMYVMHGWMHRSSWAFRYLHKKHHIPQKSCQAFDAFQFSLPDLMIENGMVPILYLLIKACLGLSVRVQLASLVLLAFQQIAEHSANPHSQFFLNPILDHFFKVTIQHQLHHAVPSKSHEDVTVVPLGHIFTAKRRKAMLDYETVFDVDLGYDLGSNEEAPNSQGP